MHDMRRKSFHRLKHVLEWEPESFYVFHTESPRADEMPPNVTGTEQLLPARRPANSLPDVHSRRLWAAGYAMGCQHGEYCTSNTFSSLDAVSVCIEIAGRTRDLRTTPFCRARTRRLRTEPSERLQVCTLVPAALPHPSPFKQSQISDCGVDCLSKLTARHERAASGAKLIACRTQAPILASSHDTV